MGSSICDVFYYYKLAVTFSGPFY